MSERNQVFIKYHEVIFLAFILSIENFANMHILLIYITKTWDHVVFKTFTYLYEEAFTYLYEKGGQTWQNKDLGQGLQSGMTDNAKGTSLNI